MQGHARSFLTLLFVCALALGCKEQESSSYSFYDERIAPVLDVGCQRQTTGCHVDDGRGFALGNLDLGSYDSLMRREDVLSAYGPYPVGVLLLKAGDSVSIDVRTIDPPDPSEPERRSVRITTDVRHAAGEGAIAQGSRNYATLKQWIDGGHTRTGVPGKSLRTSIGKCVSSVPSWPGIDIDAPLQDARSFEHFVEDVQPILKERCAGSSCHGTPLADLYLTCGSDARPLRWKYEVAVRHLDPVATSSELLRRPLAVRAGGAFHEGGDVIRDVEDKDYKTIQAWAQDIADRAPELLSFGEADEGLRFFANRVQPVLVRKGCMFQNCHSPSMFHDLRLRGGAAGGFSSIATRRNYEMSLLLLAPDAADPNQSRLIAKNLCPSTVGGEGIVHRGGVLFEASGGCATPGTRASLPQCESFDADGGDLNEVPAYCVLARWHQIEREAAIARGEILDQPGPSSVVFVTRPPGSGNATDFDTFRPGADLRIADATLDASGGLELSNARSLLGACGLGGELDVRTPAVSWNAERIAFAARSSASSPLRIYEVDAAGTSCAPSAGLTAAVEEHDGILIHDFDPTYAADGRIVFASTRGNIEGLGVVGPTRTPAALSPNANLYVFDPEGEAPLRQLTFLSNQELAPSLMVDGRLIFTAEKRALDFHQLALRRQNLDGGDYHPHFAQRPSVGFGAATDVIELANRNFAMIAAPIDAQDGAGTVVVLNRSIGPDQDDRDPADRAYIHSLSTPVPGAFGGGSGVFRSPAPLPSGRILVACDLDSSDLHAEAHAYALCELDPSGRAEPRVVYQEAGVAVLEPVALWPRFGRPIFVSRMDEPNGSTSVEANENDAVVHVTDMPVLATLLFENTREGRPIRRDIRKVELYQPEPPPNDARSFADVGDHVISDMFGEYYEDLRSLGTVDVSASGSFVVRIPGGVPVSLELQDARGRALTFGDGGPFTGPMRQREEMQFYPGERARQSLPRHVFNGMCGGCHGSISGRELDAVLDVDVLTTASITLMDDDLTDLL